MFALTTDDGVRTFVIDITCGTPAAILFVSTTIVSVFVAAFHVDDCAVAAAVAGFVHDAVGPSNDHCDCTPPSVGI